MQECFLSFDPSNLEFLLGLLENRKIHDYSFLKAANVIIFPIQSRSLRTGFVIILCEEMLAANYITIFLLNVAKVKHLKFFLPSCKDT